ncbi:MAG: sugar phosphate isomerase/epimerase [Bryobacterales bacterium]|nr:sugar phosphate isomerase/epimerase [Bryobacterales bacterium]
MKPLQVGLMFWTGGVLGIDAAPDEIVDSVAAFGVSCGQLGVHGAADLTPGAAERWRAALDRSEIEIVTAFMNFGGESYASIPICAQTVGYVPPATRREREQRTYAVSDFARSLGIPGLAAHIGCLPEDPSDAEHRAVLELVRRVCDHCARNGQTFALETGQEPAAALLEFLHAVDRPNLGVNFDPANMILYGSGEPMEALRTLREHVLTVHCKDGTWPETPGEWGRETPLGDGDVGMQRYVRTLREIGYSGPLVIEREIVGEEQRADIGRAIALLNRIRA